MRGHAHKVALGAALALAIMAGPARADFAAGMAAYTQGDATTAAAEWLAAAEAGDVAAMRNLGQLYRWGRGVEQDSAQAADWYQKAALQGLDRAMVNLAVLYLEGEGVAANPAAAVHWLTQAASQGNADAMLRLSDLTRDGVGTAADPAAADDLLARAAALGNAKAQARLQTADTGGSQTGIEDMDAVAAEPAPKAEAEPEAAPEAIPAAAEQAALPPRVSPALPEVRRADTVDGVMLHMGAYPDSAAATLAWRDVVTAVPELAAAEPYLLPGYVPGRGDLVRLYAQAPKEAMPRLCAELTKAGRECELHSFFK